MTLEAKGDCFQANANYLIELSTKDPSTTLNKDIKLCHGMVIGAKGSPVEGTTFIHAWIEHNGLLIDNSNGKKIVLPTARIEHRILRDTVKYYTIKEMFDKLLETGHYGEWD